MRIVFLLIFYLVISIPLVYSQTEKSTSADISIKQKPDTEIDKPRYGIAIFLGLGKGGNEIVTGFGSGGGVRFHYRLHTISAVVSNTDRLEYHGAQSSSSTLHSTCAGLTYGVGTYEKNFSASVGAGFGYSFVTMSTGGGALYWSTTYQKYGACIGGQVSLHGKYVGLGAQLNYYWTSSGINHSFLVGLEFNIYRK